VKRRPTAAVKWYGEGFALGAAGAGDRTRKGRPRVRAMVLHWVAGIRDGRFARDAFVHAYQARTRKESE
jgi:hypothetical protein